MEKSDNSNVRRVLCHSIENGYYRGPLGRAPLLGTLEDMLRKALDRGISLHGDPFMSEGNLELGGGSYPGDFE